MSQCLSVSNLNEYIKSVVESDFSLLNVLVMGEVSSLTKHYTGHYYFTLKDENSQIKCMMFSTYASKIDFCLENGNKVLINGYIGVYEKGGTYQLYCRKISLYGEGEYLLKLAKLKEKLQKEGLFDLEKKSIPLFPKKIALITAKTGAAVHDYISTIKKRLNTEVYLFPCLVQGEEASKSILSALKECLNIDPSLIVITRGGGSKEDLKAFNDEDLVRFVANINIPVISAVGHQIDTTLIDYVSSLSCITPTDAANHSIIEESVVKNKINFLLNKVEYNLNLKIEKYSAKLVALSKVIEFYSPQEKIKKLQEEINLSKQKLEQILLNKFNYYYQKLYYLDNKISYLSPYSLLNNGYSVLTNKENKIINSLNEVEINQKLKIKLRDGYLEVEVKEKKYDI